MQKARVLVLADQDAALESHKARLSGLNYEVHEARSLDEALKSCKQRRFPVVVADLGSGGNGEGLRAARKIREVSAETQVVLLTPDDHQDKSPDDYRVNIFAYLDRPSDKSKNRLPETIASVFEELQKTEVKKQMLSFLTHTMVNTFAGAIPALDHTLELGQQLEASDLERGEIFSVVNNLGFIRTALSTVDSMLKSYKLLVRKPENLRSAWNDERGDDSDLEEVLESAISATIHRLMFQEALYENLDRFATQLGQDTEQIQDQFMAEVLLARPADKPTSTQWTSRNFRFIEVNVDASKQPLKRDGIRSNIIFSVLTELLLNSIKYTNETPIKIHWETDKTKHLVSVKNRFDPKNRPKGGSKEGQNFISALLRPLDGLSVQFSTPSNPQESKKETKSLSRTTKEDTQEGSKIFEATFAISLSALTEGG